MDERRIIRNGHPGKLMPHCSKYFETFANAIVCLRCMCLADKDASGEEGKKCVVRHREEQERLKGMRK